MRPLRQKGAWLLFLVLLGAAVRAEPGPGDLLSPEEAVLKALSTDPRLKRDQALAEGARAFSEGAGALPNPVLQLSGVAGDAREGSNSLTQTFEIAGQPRLRGLVATWDSEAAAASFEKTRRDVARETGRTYYDYWEAQALAALYGRRLEFARRLETIAKKRLSLGEISPHEEFRVRQIGNDAEIALSEVEGTVAVAGRKLEFLIGSQEAALPAPEGKIPTAPDFKLLATDHLDVLQSMAGSRPELVAAESLARKAHFESQLAERGGAPDFQVTAYRSNLGYLAEQGVQFSMVIPLFDWGRLGAEAARRRKSAEASAYEVGVVKREIDLGLYSAFTDYQVARRKRESSLELAVDYIRFIEVAQQGYEIGLLSFVEVFDSQRANLRGLETYIRAEAEYHRAQVDLWWVSGLPPVLSSEPSLDMDPSNSQAGR